MEVLILKAGILPRPELGAVCILFELFPKASLLPNVPFTGGIVFSESPPSALIEPTFTRGPLGPVFMFQDDIQPLPRLNPTPWARSYTLVSDKIKRTGMEDIRSFKADLDPKSVQVRDEHATAEVIVVGPLQKQHVFGVTWKPGHEPDWSWQGAENWLKTEFNAEHAGLEPATLIELVGTAVMNYAREHRLHDAAQPHPEP